MHTTENVDNTVGTAEMDTLGTITLRLRACADGMVGQGTLVYPTSHPQYESILAHIGDIKPGETKPVAPWD